MCVAAQIYCLDALSMLVDSYAMSCNAYGNSLSSDAFFL